MPIVIQSKQTASPETIRRLQELERESRAVEERKQASARMHASSGKLKSGFGYSESLDVITKDPQAKLAYAMADIVGVSSDVVEKRGYSGFIRHVLDESVNNTLGKWVEKKSEIDSLDGYLNPEAKMLRFARAISALANEEFGPQESFSSSGQETVMYAITGQHAKGNRKGLLTHAVECASSVREFKTLSTVVDDASGAYRNIEPRLLERARREQLKRETLFAPTPNPSEKFDPARHAHWKLHLGFEQQHNSAVEQALALVKSESGGDIFFKIGHSSDQEGKDATVYCGSRDKAQEVAKKIINRVGSILNEPAGEVLKDDIAIEGKVWGRFDMGKTKTSFHQYGSAGIPFLSQDLMALAGAQGEAERSKLRLAGYTQAYDLLSQHYGKYFTGTQKIERLSA